MAGSSFVRMVCCASGIMISLVLYGLLQERIMTRPYGDEDSEGVYFTNSTFLVFNNRVIAILIALGMIYYNKEPIKNQAPLWKCGAISLSNTIATFCQYEALKYVSFPTQTLGKCGKMIPVMILGMVLSRKKYEVRDFGVAGVVTLGCLLFVLTGDIGSKHKEEEGDSTYGLLLMGAYLFSDGFTSTLQEQLFRGYKMSISNQMLYVSLCSAIISLISLISSNQFMASLSFSYQHSDFLRNSIMLSAAAAIGQFIILTTIKEFGALFFATVMTVRQVVSIILSCLIYMHPLSLAQWISSSIVFGVLYWKDANKPKSSHHSHGGGGSHHPPHSSTLPLIVTTPPDDSVQLIVDKDDKK